MTNIRTRPTSRRILAAPLIVLLVAAAPVGATCPDDMCDCFPSAKNFDVVASDTFSVATGSISYSGSPEFFQSILDGDICSGSAKVVGNNNAETELQSIVALAGSGLKAIKIRTKKIPSYTDNGVLIHGDVASGGGIIDGALFADIDGSTDASGGSPLVASCQGAVADLASATTALTPPAVTVTQTIGDKIVKGIDDSIDATAPGVNVIQAGKILVKPMSVSGSPEAGNLDITTDSATTAVIILTTKLAVGNECTISATDPEKVVFVVTGPGPRVAIGKGAEVDSIILAKDRVVAVGAGSVVANIFASKITLKGTEMDDGLGCSPSGAFLNATD